MKQHKNIESMYPLSHTQEGMLFHTLYGSESNIYFEQLTCILQGEFNRNAFKKAWQHVTERHPVLRTMVVWKKGKKPFQIVRKQVKLPWIEYDWRSLISKVCNKRLEIFLKEDRKQGFIIDQAPLMRFAIIQVTDDTYHFIWSFHHLLMDGWCLPIILKEVFTLYEAFCQEQELHLPKPRPYRDYIAWLQKQDLSKAENFWKQQLNGFTNPTPFRVDNRTDNRLTTGNYEEQTLKLSKTTTDGLLSLAQQHHLTLNILVQGAWSLLMSRYSGEEDIVFGATVSGRPTTLAGVESMLGLFINTLPVRVLLDSKTLLLPWLQQLHSQQIEYEQYSYTPLVDIQSWSEVPGGTSLFESIVVFENYPIDNTLKEEQQGTLSIRSIHSIERTNYPLTLVAVVHGSELVLRTSYDTNRFENDTISRMMGHIKMLLEGMVANPAQCIGELPLLTEAEHQQLKAWNNTTADYPSDKCIHQLFEAQVEQNPNTIAVVFENQELTYQELNTKANQLAHFLQTLGVKPEILVGICIERSLEMVIGLLGILKAGGAYVPLDPTYPETRLKFMLEDANIPVLLTQSKLVGNLPQQKAQTVYLDTEWEKFSQLNSDNFVSEVEPSNLAYVIYTSGSTGKPKGVLVTHYNVMRLFKATQSWFHFNEQDIWTLFHSLAFDFSVWELWGALLYGGRLVIVPYWVSRSPDTFYELLDTQHVTILNQTPSAFRQLIQTEEQLDKEKQLGKNNHLNLRLIIFGGETLEFQTLKPWFEQHNDQCPQLVNMYGITETTVHVTYRPLTLADLNSPGSVIGFPIPDLQVYILEHNLQPMPIGLPGELHIGGAGVAQGYLNRPQLMAERFIQNPFCDDPNARLYKTGDLARYLPDGNIEYLGRIDNQVKIRGFRIELGEIETILAQHHDVRESVVIVHETSFTAKRLIAFVVVHEGQTIDNTKLRGFLAKRLPEYMIPSIFVSLEAIPLTPNGKIDHKVLSQISGNSYQLSEKNFVAPRTLEEELLANIWADILDIPRVGVHDNFFEMGGHSLLATKVISQIRDTFSMELPLRYLFELPTIAGLVEYLSESRWEDSLPPVTLVNRNQPIPLSFGQQRLWLINQLDWENLTYNLPVALRLEGHLHVKALTLSLREVVQRHESLRTTFPIVNGQPIQLIHPIEMWQLIQIDLQSIASQEQKVIKEVQRLFSEEMQRPFDSSKEQLFRTTLLKIKSDLHFLFVTMHHLTADGESMNIFFQEFTKLYDAFSQDKPSPLSPLPVQYVDYTLWQKQWFTDDRLETQIKYWQQQLSELPALLELPTDKPRLPIQTFRGNSEHFEITTELYRQLIQISRKNGVTLFMTLLTAFTILFFRYSKQEDIVVGSPIAYRNRSEIESLIGFFANTLLLRTNLSDNPRFIDLLTHVKQVALDAYAHQDVPLEKIMEIVQPVRTTSYNPLFQVMFVLLNVPPLTNFKLSNLTLTVLESKSTTSHFDLDILMEENIEQEKLFGIINFNVELFNTSTIIRMVKHFQTLLEEIVATPEQRIAQFTLGLDDRDLARLQSTPAPLLPNKKITCPVKAQDEDKKVLVVTATFTAEPLKESLNFWMQKLDIPFKVEFAPYNQVFQQLLDSSSLLSKNETGINIILVRFEDWTKSEDSAEVITEINKNVHEFSLAIKSAKKRSANSYILCICPNSPLTPHHALYQQMEDLLTSWLKAVNGLYLIKTSDLSKSYPVSQFYDPHGDELGHIPYTPVFFTALGTIIARKINAIKNNPYKVIVLDCDGTLWQGICAEDGPLGVKIDSSYQMLQTFMVEQQKAGKVLCLCSKNTEEDVFAVFEQRNDMFLKREHLVAWRVNWQPKSENLKSLSEELNLGLDSFIFVDDNPVECAEVQAHCPTVTTVQLPCKSNHIPQFLKQIWAFDLLETTLEDQQRTKLYQQNLQREHWRDEALTFTDFLDGLQLEINISTMISSQINRVSQLTQRTNQFNLTTIRRTESEIQKLCDSEGFECWIVKVKDRFGDYGLVGVMLFQPGVDTIIVDTFLLSCRVLGRGVEHKMLARLGEIGKERQLDYLDIPYKTTQKNEPVLNFLESVAGQFKQPLEVGGWQFRLPVESIAKLTYSSNNESKIATAKSLPVRESAISQIEIQSPTTLFNQIATEWFDAEHILKTIEFQNKNQRPQLDSYVAPRNPIEEILVGILGEVLQLERVGIYDDFFKLGGHSLLGVQVMSRICSTFSVELPLRYLFDFPTVITLSKQIQIAQHEEQNIVPPIELINRSDELPLSFAQERLWFLNQLTHDNPFYNTPTAVRLVGILNIAALTQSLKEIVKRHETLRTNFQIANGKPVQVIHPSSTDDIQFLIIDLQGLPENKRSVEVQYLATEEAQHPFDIKCDRLLRATLLKLQSEENVLLVTLHHIISDAWSLGILVNELSSLYKAFSMAQPSPLPKLPIQYVDFAHWQRQWLSGVVLETQLHYWQQQLDGAPRVLEISTDYPRPPVHTFRGSNEYFEIPPKLTQQLKSFSQQENVTLFMTLLAAFAILLSHYSGQKDIVIGSPIANRTRQEIETLIGFFVNTLALRIDLSGNPTFLDLLKRVRKMTLDAYAHQELPFEQLVEALQPERDMTRNPLVQVALAFQNVPMPSLELKELTLSSLDFESKTVRFDLEFFLWETEGKVIGNFCYYTDLFEAVTIKRLLGHFKTLLIAIAEEPKKPIFEYSLLSEAERHQLLVEWNNTQTNYPRNKCIHQLFEAQVEQNPNAIAVVFENQSLTYKELNTKANQLAHHLQTLGVKPEILVGICVERSLEMVYGLLSILKAGGAYVPLDPNYPQERLALMLEDSDILILLTQQKLMASLLEQNAYKILCLDSNWGEISKNSTDNPICHVQSDNLAYVIYTSGSTGKPKGVQITHQALTNFLSTMHSSPGLTDQDILLAVTTISFDIAALELYLPLMMGAKIVLASRQVASDGVQLLEVLNNSSITVMQATPATWRMLLMAGWEGSSHLKILIGGEALPKELARQLLDKSHQVWNMYGPTETTIWSTIYQINVNSLAAQYLDTSESIGCPIANTEIYVLDANFQIVPVGVPGELYIGGEGVARGYLNRPELTAEKFIPNPFNDKQGRRLYKTGDLVRYLRDDNIEYLNRIDNQIKMRGFRIELGEIEAVLRQHPAIQQTVVTCTETQSNDKRLIAYVVSDLDSDTQDDSSQEFYAEQISQWEHVWHENYSQSITNQDSTFNIAGWNSSYTGLPIQEEEMREWLNSTVNAILSLQPNCVLEIGCGTGLLLSRIAPHCSQYWGTDFSPVVLQHVEQLKHDANNLDHVTLFNREADDFTDISETFDTVILNSVIQYFPDVNYFLNVLDKAIKVVKPGGYIFIGDVRNLLLLKAYHTSVQLYQAPNSLTQLELQQRLQQSIMQEEELVIDPTFFMALKQHFPQLTNVQIQLKRGHHHNELTRFRYDVILQVGSTMSEAIEIPWQNWQTFTLSTLRQHLIKNQPDIFGLRHVPNARLNTEIRSLEWLANATPTETIGQLRQTLSKSQSAGIEPEELWEFSNELPYDVVITWVESGHDGSYDVLFKHRHGQLPITHYPLPITHYKLQKPWHHYTNNPLQGKMSRKLVPQLRQFLRNQLPDYMVPSAFVMLEAIPLTPNGKIDRCALLTLETFQGNLENYIAPCTATEETLASIWREILGLEQVGIHDNFFEVGGHSLLATQVMSRIRDTFSVDIPLHYLFESPTVASFAQHIEKTTQANDFSVEWEEIDL
ncbi:amino acid adenylation domain-containing protein [Candidatus Parabeggiatoa sp. HSG14]|uniref:amino acid adenylation domain-containing protein n=1 Tax=Candidatus Parabeggiatoa sp. HSG14 TaxID=3055593 RepID=UPI0025A74260|nr:amino acid adenylation domain-containing protein [Thiotrichales bacterium HSG14]